MEARCQCGAVSFTIPSQLLVYSVCHCNKCKMITGSAFNVAAVFTGFDFPPASVADKLGVFVQGSDVEAASQDGYFCKTCGNRMAHVPKRDGKYMPVVSVSAPRIVGFDWDVLKDPKKTMHVHTKHAVIKRPTEGEESKVLWFEEQHSDEEVMNAFLDKGADQVKHYEMPQEPVHEWK